MAKVKKKPAASRSNKPVKKLPRKANPKYKSHFLKQVIVRVDFATDLGIAKAGPAAKFTKAISKVFPTKGVRKLRLRMTQEGAAPKSVSESTEWTYQNKAADKTVVLGPRALLIEYTKYESFETLCDEFLLVLESLFITYDAAISRVGLRYVNHIELDEIKPMKWDTYLVPALLSSFELADKVETVSRSFTVLEFTYPDESRLRFCYGMSNPDYPAPIKRKLFILDFDAHCDMIVERNQIPELLVLFHGRTSGAFEQVILPPLRKKMGGTS